MVNKKVYLKPGKEESLLRYHPWVFSGALSRLDDGIEEGEIVDVLTSKRTFIARGHFQIGSIAVRVLTFDEQEQIDNRYWTERLLAAKQMRDSLDLIKPGMTDTYRLVHGEGDNLPGLVIDIYGKTAVMQAHSAGMHLCRLDIAKALQDVMQGSVENIYYKSETTLPFKADLLARENGFIVKAGNGSDENIGLENGLKFRVDWLKGQKTGFFVDQRDNRSLLERYARGRKVLNMFCYTGGFSCYALRGGAVLVHSVDSSAKAISLTDENVAMNFPNETRHQSFAEDAFKFLENSSPLIPHPKEFFTLHSSLFTSEDSSFLIPNSSFNYDLIILDPPAFAKHRDALRNGLRGYIRLNAKAMEKIAHGGILFTFSCSQVVSKDNFRAAVFTAAAQSHRRVRILHQLTQPADHPVNIYHPEGEYLKGLVLYVE